MDLEELKETKEFKKARTKMSPEMALELVKKSDEELKSIIHKNTVFIKKETEKLKNTPEYVKIAEEKKLLDSGIKEALDPYKAASDLAAKVLKERQG